MNLENYPLGPNLRQYLNIKEYSGENTLLDDAAAKHLGDLIAEQIAMIAPTNIMQATDIIDELVAMDQPEAALKLAELYPDIVNNTTFRGQFGLGCSAMLVGDSDTAIDYFIVANEMMPEEPAPYVNLAQIFLAEHNLEDARHWVDAGLRIDANNHKLWELAYQIDAHLPPSDVAKLLSKQAMQHRSWVGASLAAEIADPERPDKKALALLKLYHQGERNTEFLIELTACFGMAGEFDRIPAIVWEARNVSGKPAWQLEVHLLQAFLSLNQRNSFLENAAQLILRQDLPPETRASLEQLVKEVQSEVERDKKIEIQTQGDS